MEQDILNEKEKEWLIEILIKSGRCSKLEKRKALIRQIGLRPDEFDLEGEARDFATNFIFDLNDAGRDRALKKIVEKVGLQVPRYQREVVQLRVKLGILPPAIKQPPVVQHSTRMPPQQRPKLTIPVSLPTKSNPIALIQKIWFLLLPIVLIWALIAKNLPDVPSDRKLLSLLVSGAVGGVLSGVFAGLAWKRTVPSVEWEQFALLCPLGGLVIGGISWAIAGNFLSRDSSGAIGTILGLIVAVAIFWGLAQLQTRR